jgi:hypothetical protein
MSGVRRVPVTLIWLTLLAATTIVGIAVGQDAWHHVLVALSTNLVNLAHGRVDTFISSGAFLDDVGSWPTWIPYLAVAFGFLEAWVGWRRALLAVFSVHVVATLVSEAWIAWLIRVDGADRGLRAMVDVGVSYVVLAAAGALVARVPTRWLPWVYGLALAAYVLPDPIGYALHGVPDPTAIGHPVALVLGMIAGLLLRRARTAPAPPPPPR